jgi:hypothetical protein
MARRREGKSENFIINIEVMNGRRVDSDGRCKLENSHVEAEMDGSMVGSERTCLPTND